MKDTTFITKGHKREQDNVPTRTRNKTDTDDRPMGFKSRYVFFLCYCPLLFLFYRYVFMTQLSFIPVLLMNMRQRLDQGDLNGVQCTSPRSSGYSSELS